MNSSNRPPDRERELFDQAFDLESTEERAAFLDRACAGDAALRQRIDNLLRNAAQGSQFLPSQPANAPTNKIPLPPDEETVGSTIGRYKLLEKVGEGGFGSVYVAEQREPVKRRVALKIIKLGMDTREVVARFEAERQALAMMDHPNIAKVLDAGSTEHGRPYFVMELVSGVPITKYCDEHHLGVRERLELFVHICQAIQHAHQKGIVHRDIKPSNILVTMHDGVPVPKVIDFGIAKAIDQKLTDKTLFTNFNSFIGTPAYMSPEQAEMSGLDIDTRSDIYSLGVLLYELLTGKTPFDAKELRDAGLDAMRRTIKEKEPVRPSTRLQSMVEGELNTTASHRHAEPSKLIRLLCGDLDWVVMKALEKDRTRRYETANGFAQDIHRHLNSEPVVARPPSTLYRFQKMARRNRFAFAAAGAVLFALLAGLGLTAWQAVRAIRAERVAKVEAANSGQSLRFLWRTLAGLRPEMKVGKESAFYRELLDTSTNRAERMLAGEPKVQARVRDILADAYWELSLLPQAQQQAEQARQIWERTTGVDSIHTLLSLQRLAVIYLAQGRRAEAESLLRSGLEKSQRIFGAEHPVTLKGMAAVATLHADQGQLAESVSILQHVLEAQRRKLGSNDLDTLKTMISLADSYRQQGKLTNAEAIIQQTLAIQRQTLGPEDPDTLLALNTLAALKHDQGFRAEAIALFRQSLGILLHHRGPEHPFTLMAMNNLAAVLPLDSNDREAEQLATKALQNMERVLGPEHPEVFATMGTVASQLLARGRTNEAKNLYQQALAGQEKVLGLDHHDTWSIAINLGNLLMQTQERGQAETLFRQVLDASQRKMGGHYSLALAAMNNIAVLCSEDGRLDEAERINSQATEIMNRVYGPEHPDTLKAMNNLALLLVKRGKVADAVQILREVLAVQQRIAPEQLDTMNTAQNLARLLDRQDDCAGAAPLFRTLIRYYSKQQGSNSESALSFSASLGRLLSDWAWTDHTNAARTAQGVAAPATPSDRAREAEQLLRTCLDGRRNASNTPPWRIADVQSRLGFAMAVVAVSDPALTPDARLSKLTEAERVLLESFSALGKAPGTNPAYQREACLRLIRLYEAWPKPDRAAEWRRKMEIFKGSANTN